MNTETNRTRPPFRADHVGSMLRPAGLIEMRRKWKAGEATLDELRQKEDEEIRAVVALQEETGLKSITDGEFRRESFHHDFLQKIKGVEFAGTGGATVAAGKGSGKRAPFVAIVSERMEGPAGGIETENFTFLQKTTKETAKLCIPSPTMTHFRGGRKAISEEAYPDMDEFFADLARVYREEIAALGEAGCRYLQYDDTNLAYLCDERMREGARALGEDPDELPRTYAALINDSIKERPAGMAVCIHLCRGNSESKWFAEGGYEPVAEVIFNLTEVDGFFLEYDDDRSGDFAPLRFVPEGMMIVLGLVTSKRGRLEDKDMLKRRIDEAAKYVDMDQLCLSPQCGFSSNTLGNKLTPDEAAAKLRLVVETAAEIWG